MNSLEDAILRTILYADVFNFPLTLPEIHHFLIATTPASLRAVEETMMRSERLQRVLVCVNGYFMRVGREALAETRQARETASQSLWGNAITWGRWLGRLPFVRMVALTGSLAVHNAVDDDDIDYIIVTAEGRVWLTRALAIVVVRLARLRGVLLCPNYVLAESALKQTRHDIFMAHEIAQMIPVYGHNVYAAMRQANEWVADQLPNAKSAFYPIAEGNENRVWLGAKSGAEMLLAGRVGNALESWERERKLRRFAPSLETRDNDARLDAQHVKGHFNDRGNPALSRYLEYLRAFELD
ncbi:MAG: hypothetical protein SF123_08520 [Chloroflexota bacterium]|nr:hypothetical protein [Chloroflexota bacterium]